MTRLRPVPAALASALLLPLLALLAVAPPARANRIAAMEPEKLDELLARLQHLPIGQRVETVSKLFVGTPYVDFPLGEGGTGPEPQPRFRLDGVDCQTFVETVLALSNASSVEQARHVLDDIRYSSSVSFANRNHFTEAQWLPSNIEKGYVREAIGAIDGRAPQTELVLRRAQWSKIGMLKRLDDANIPEGKFPIKYLPVKDMKRKGPSIESGSIVLVVRQADPKRVVRVSHMGFVIHAPRGMLIRHAAAGDPKAVIDEPIDAYLERVDKFKSWRVVGFGLVAPLDAKVRASQFLR